MRRLARQLPKQLKDQITAKLLTSDGSVSDLSKLHGVGRSTLCKWRREARKKSLVTGIESSHEKFVELRLEDTRNHLPGSKLIGASLTFEDFTISIEGKVGSSKFISIFKILEELC